VAFLTSMRKQRKSASPSAIQVKNRRKTVSIGDKFHVINRPEKDERIVDKCRDVRPDHSSVHTNRNSADMIIESAKSGTKVFDCIARQPHFCRSEPYQKTMDVRVSYILLHVINKYTV
jgi:hypothetical protein